LNSSIRVGWQQALSQQSSLQTNVAWQRADVIATSNESSRLDLNLNYRQDLTEDWVFLARARRSWLESTNDGNEQQDEIFVGLQASLKWRP